MKNVFYTLICILIFSSCSDNAEVKYFGKDITIQVPIGMKVSNAGWDENTIYYFTEKMEDNYNPKLKILYSKNRFSKGTVTFIESK